MADFDPVTASASALAHGRIGLVAWAIFERGDGLVLSFEKQGRYFTIEVDSGGEKAGFLRLVSALLDVAPDIDFEFRSESATAASLTLGRCEATP